MALSSNQSLFLSLCSLFMGILFAYSASVQLNDPGALEFLSLQSSPYPFMYQIWKLTQLFFFPDWYCWFPVYALASGVNLLHMNFTWRAINQGVVLILCGGILLLIKVLVEAQVYGLSGFWCMDMRERIVREKIGSGLVVLSMSLHLRSSASLQQLTRERKTQYPGCAVSGKGISYLLGSYVFCWILTLSNGLSCKVN